MLYEIEEKDISAIKSTGLSPNFFLLVKGIEDSEGKDLVERAIIRYDSILDVINVKFICRVNKPKAFILAMVLSSSLLSRCMFERFNILIEPSL